MTDRGIDIKQFDSIIDILTITTFNDNQSIYSQPQLYGCESEISQLQFSIEPHLVILYSIVSNLNLCGFFSCSSILRNKYINMKTHITSQIKDLICTHHKHLNSNILNLLMSNFKKTIYYNNGIQRFYLNKDFYIHMYKKQILQLLLEYNYNCNYIDNLTFKEELIDMNIVKTNIHQTLKKISKIDKIYNILQSDELRSDILYLYNISNETLY